MMSWTPTHIQVTVQRAKGLLIKGKNGTNNCFVTIVLGKEKYQTSVKDKAAKNVDWHEECELAIPDQGNRAELILTCLHRNTLGIDEFLGQVILPLNEMDIYERPRSKWYKLQSKPGKESKKERGEIEVRVLFIVKSGSLTDLSKKEKHKSSLSQLASSVGGSLLSLGGIEKKKGIKKFAKSLSTKMHINSKMKKETDDSDISGSFSTINTSIGIGQTRGDADPGVISEDEDEFVLDNLSNKSSGSSLNMNKINQQTTLSKDDIDLRSKTLPPSSYPTTDTQLDEWQTKLYGKNLDIDISDSLKRRSWETSRVLSQKEEKKVLEEKKTPIKSTQNKFNVEEKSMGKDKTDTDSIHSQYSPESVSSISNVKDTVFNQPKENFRPKMKHLALLRSNTTGNLLESLSKESENERTDKIDKKRFGKLKYFRKVSEKHDNHVDSVVSNSNQVGERIIVGHENHIIKNGDKIEVSKEILKRYEGKSREEVVLIANGLENEVCYQRQRVKELEDYLDNLLLRVMETQPKILQTPYDRNISTKSG